MTKLKIVNQEECEIVYGSQLPLDQRNEFDYLNDDDFECNEFFKYRGNYYDISQFMKCDKNSAFEPFWHGYHGDSFFSGVLIHLHKCGDGVIAATYLS